MADNYFAQFGSEQNASEPVASLAGDRPQKAAENFFAAFDAEPDAMEIARPEQPVTVPEADWTGQGFRAGWTETVYEKMQRVNAAQNRAEKKTLDEKRGNGFFESLFDPTQYTEFFKGIAPGGIRFAGSTLKGVAGVQSSFIKQTQSDAQRILDVVDAIDRGEKDIDETGLDLNARTYLSVYRGMSPEMRKEYRAHLESTVSVPVTPVRERTFYEAGKAVTDFAETLLPAAPGYRAAVGRQLGEGIGSLLAGLPAAYLGRASALTFFGAGGSGEAVERAIQKDDQLKREGKPGLTEEQIATAALWGIAPGATDVLPVEVLLGRLRIPAPFRARFARAIMRIGGQAFIEGMQEGGQAFLQNLIARQIYDESQSLTQGIVPEAGMGAGVGGIAEVGRLLLSRLAGRHARQRGGSPAPQSEEEITLLDIANEIDRQAEEGTKPAPVTAEQQTEAPQAPQAPQTEAGAEEQPAVPAPVTPETEAAGPETAPAPEQQVSEEQKIVPVLESIDAEIGTPVLVEAYNQLSPEQKTEFIGRISENRDEIANVVAKLAADAGLSEQQITQAQQIVQETLAAEGPSTAGEIVETPALQMKQTAAPEAVPEPVGIQGPFQVYAIPADSSKPYLSFIAEMGEANAHRNARANRRFQNVPVSGYEFRTRDGKTYRFDYGEPPEATPASAPASALAEGVRESQQQSAVRRQFADLLNSRMPPSQWANRLNIDETQLEPLIEEAVKKGFLRRTANGKLRRVPKSQQSGSFAAMAIPEGLPETVSGEGSVALTPEAGDVWADAKAAVNRAALQILPDAAKVEVLDNIKIAQLKREDQLLALRYQETTSAPSATMGYAPEDRTAVGRESGEAAATRPRTGAAAAVGEGIPPAAPGEAGTGISDRALSRIVRQESATVDENGDIIAGRPSRKTKTLRKGGKGLAIQRPGKTEPFSIDGFDGRVTAEKLTGRDQREGNLSRLTYEIFETGTMKTAPVPLGELEITQRADGAWETNYVEIRQPREGIGARLYDAVEKDLGIRMAPSGVLSEKGHAFWKKRSPASVQWHVRTPTLEGMIFSPRKISDELDRVGREIRDLSMGTGHAAAIPAAEREEFRKAYVKERGELIRLYTKLPAEARAVKDQMFALAGRRAQTANASSRVVAEQMEARGRTQQSIWQQTGWLRGPDQKWRFEIDDSAAKVINLDKITKKPTKSIFARIFGSRPAKMPPNVRAVSNIPLPDILHHPKLFAAYPFLRRMRVNLIYGKDLQKSGELRVRQDPKRTTYLPIRVVASSESDIKSVLIHEIQHYIQNHEGFARGAASPQEGGTESARGGAPREQFYDPSQRYGLPVSHTNIIDSTRAERLAENLLTLYEAERTGDPDQVAKARRDIPDLEKALEEALRIRPETYGKSFGEFEARLTEERMNLTPEERRRSYPFEYLPPDLEISRHQTQNYQQAYDEIMRRAAIIKAIKERWAERKDLGDDVFVVRDSEETLGYFNGEESQKKDEKEQVPFYPNNMIVYTRLFPQIGRATIDPLEQFYSLAYDRQKKIMDVIYKDIRSRNMVPGFSHYTQEGFAFWSRYDPGQIILDPRLYRDALETAIKREYGGDAQLVLYKDKNPETGQPYEDAYEPYGVYVKTTDKQNQTTEIEPVPHEVIQGIIPEIKPEFSPEARGIDRDVWYESQINAALSERGMSRDAMFALRGFYSPAIRAAESISQNKGTGEQFWKQISKSPGVRKDELDWMELEEFLRGKKPVTKDEVLQFMRAHQIELDEKILGEGGLNLPAPTLREISYEDAKKAGMELDDELDKPDIDKIWSYEFEDRSPFIIIKTFDDSDEGKYSIFDLSNQLSEGSSTLDGAQHIGQSWWHNQMNQAGNVRFERLKVPGGENYRELLIRFPHLEGIYKTPHFQNQEIVHLRVDDRIGKNGEKVLFINEVQSDLHQKGRARGYLPERTRKRILELENKLKLIRKKRLDLEDKKEFSKADEEREKILAAQEELKTVLASEPRKLPDAPFKHDLWLELALKRALLYAAENGYDAVSWARSDQIAKAVSAVPERLAPQYDQKIGRFYNKYAKKWGGKVDESPVVEIRNVIDGSQIGFDRDNQILRITPEMRASVIEGQPLAMRRMPPALQPEALGQTDPYTMTISIAMRAVEAEARAKGVAPEQEAVRVLRHEAVEFFKGVGLFDDAEWNTLQSAAKRQGWVETKGVRGAYEALNKDGLSDAELNELLVKEAIAEQYSEFHLGRKQFKGKVAEIFQRIKDFLGRVTNFMRGEGFQTWEDVFERIDEGEFKARFEQAFPELAPQPRAGEGIAPMQATAGKIPDSPARRPAPGTARPEQSLADLVGNFNHALGLTVRKGRLDPGLKRAAAAKGHQLRGQTSRETGVVRLKIPNEIDTLVHEGGHALENRFKGKLDRIKNMFAAELTKTATPTATQLSEGFAEWFRRYVTNPAAATRRAPGFEIAFEDFLKGESPEMLASLQSIRTGYQDWVNAPSGGAVASSIVTSVSPGSIKAVMREFNVKGLRDTMQAWTDRLYTTLFDDLHPIRLVVNGLLDIAAVNLNVARDKLGLKTTDDAYKLLRMARDSYSAGHMDLMHGVHDYQSVQPSGPSLRDAIATAFGGFGKDQWNDETVNEFGAYLASRRMVQEWGRFKRGELSLPPDKFSLGDHQQSVRDFEAKYPQFATAALQVYAFNNNMLRKKRDAGLIEPKFYDELIKKQDYVPLMRDMSDRGWGVEGGKSKRSDKYSVIGKFRGSQRDIINPLESIAKDAYETAEIIARNDAIKALDALARAAGPDGGKFAERIPAHEMKATQVNVQDVLKLAAMDAGIDEADAQIMIQAVDDQLGDNAVVQVWRAGEISERGEAIVYLWENGNRIPIRLADGQFGHDMLHAIAGLNREASHWLVNALSVPSTILRTGVTASLDFIGANYIRDQVSAWILTRDFVPFWDGARGIYDDLTMNDVARIYSRVGGIMGGSSVAAQHESRIKREVGALRRKGIRFTLNPFTRDFWRMTEFSETGTRLGVFKRAFDRAKGDGLSDWEATVEAAYIARDYIDFGRRGSRMLAVRRLFPFLNAALQGLDRGIRGIRGRVDAQRALRDAISPYIKSRTGQPLSIVERQNLRQSAQVWAYTALLGVIGISLSMLYKDDEEYEEISDYMKATHWLFRIDGEWVRIPKPFELAFVSNLMERTFDYTYKDDPTAYDRFWLGLYEITVPPHSVPGPVVSAELATDYNLFTGRPIVGPFLKRLPPELQFNGYASEFGKYLAKQINVAPAYIDHFITGFGASWGREFVNASDRALPFIGRTTGGVFGLPTKPSADPAVQDYFFIRRFTTAPERGSTSIQEFWDLMALENGAFEQAASGYKQLVEKIRDAKGAQEFLDRLTPEERAYALMRAGNSGQRAKYRRLHPLERAREILQVAGGIKKEINLNRLYKSSHLKGEPGDPIVLSPSKMRTVTDLLSDIIMREARNSLIALKRRGWAQKKMLRVDTVHDELQAVAPDVHKELVDRLSKKKLPSFETVVEAWPVARDRILENGRETILMDLYRRDYSIGQGSNAAAP